ncbi:MAG: GMC oxidoreductase [Pseudonocardiaceae bacterium]
MNALEQYDAIVVGSGFGGSISALRLAQAGKSVLVLERGRRYRAGEFPRDVTDIDRLFWSSRYHRSGTGLYDIRFFSGISVVVASGVGGGSLIYANINIRPDPVVFEDSRWPAKIDVHSLGPYYDKVAAALAVRPLPADIHVRKRDFFRAAAGRVGRPVFDPDEAVIWEQTPDMAAGRGACRFVAECEFGCQYGAKNSVDVMYLAHAERLGAMVRTGVVVSCVRPVQGGYAVEYRDTAGAAAQAIGRRVVLAAGTLGTNEILLRSRDEAGTLPDISAMLGRGFSGNGDFLGSIQNASTDLSPQYGPDVTSVIRYFDEAPEFTMAAPTFNAAVMAVLASLGQPRGRALRLFAPLLWGQLERILPWAFAKGLISGPSRLPARHAGDPNRMTNLFAIGRDNANGRLLLTRRRLDIVWDYARENQMLVDRMVQAMREVGDAYGGTFAPLVTWNMFKRIISVHPLGGCRMSDSPEGGVVSPEGEAYGYPGLFVADGSVVPTSIGFHPAMTISALAEHTAEAVIASYPA